MAAGPEEPGKGEGAFSERPAPRGVRQLAYRGPCEALGPPGRVVATVVQITPA